MSKSGDLMGRSMEGLANKVGIPSEMASGFGKMAATAGPAALAISGVAVAVAGAAIAIKKSIEAAEGFQAAMQEVKSLQIPEVTENFEAIRGSVSELAATLGIDAVDAAKAAYNALSAGVPAGELMQFLEASAVGAVGGLASLADTGAVVGTVMNTFGESAGSANEIVDVLFGTVKAGVTTFPELASSVGLFAGTAAAANVTLEESAAALALLTKSFPSTSQAATALNQAMLELGKPGDALAAALGDVTLAGDGLDAVLAKLNDSAEAAGVPVSNFFSSSTAGAAALQLAADEGGAYAESLDAIENSAGSAKTAMDIINDSWTRQKELLSGQVMGALREVGLEILDKLTPALAKLNEWLGPLLNVAVAIAKGALNGLIGAFRIVWGFIGLFIEFWRQAWIGFSEQSGISIQFIMAALKLAGIALVTYGKVTWAVLKAIASIFFAVFSGAGKLLGRFFGAMNKTSGDGLRDFIKGFRDATKAILMSIGRMVEKGALLITKFINHIISTLGVLAQIPFIAELLGGITSAVAQGLEGVTEAINEGTTAIDMAADDALNSLRSLNTNYEINLDPIVVPPDGGGGGGGGVADAAEAAGRAAGANAAKAAGEGAKEALLIDLAKKMAEAFQAGLKAMQEIMGADMPLLSDLMPKIKVIEDFAVQLGLAVQRAALALDPDEGAEKLKRLVEGSGALKAVIDVFKAGADLVKALVDMAEPNLAALESLTPLIDKAATEFLKIATLTEFEAENVKRYADTMKPVVDLLKTAAELDLGKVTRITEQQLNDAMGNVMDAGRAVYIISTVFRDMSAQAQTTLMEALQRFATVVGSVVSTLKAVADLNLEKVTAITAKDLEITKANLLAAAQAVWEMSEGWRDLSKDAQEALVGDFVRFGQVVAAITSVLSGIASVKVEKVATLTVEVIDALKHNVLAMAALVWDISSTFRDTLSPREQQALLDSMQRFAGTVGEMVKTLKSILEIPVPSVRIGDSSATAVFNTAFGWTVATVQAFAVQTRMLIGWLEDALSGWQQSVAPKAKEFADAVKPVVDILKAILDVPAPKYTVKNSGSAQGFAMSTAFGWTMATVQVFAQQARLLVGWLEDALSEWKNAVTPKAKEFADAVKSVIDALSAIVELPVAPVTSGVTGNGGIVFITWSQQIVDNLVQAAIDLLGKVNYAVAQWRGKVQPRVAELGEAVGDMVDALGALVSLPVAPEFSGATGQGGRVSFVTWSQATVNALIDTASAVLRYLDEAITRWKGKVNPRMGEMADAIDDAIKILGGALSLNGMDVAKLVPVKGSAIDIAVDNIRLIISRLSAIIGDAEGQISSEMMQKVKALAEAFLPVQEVLGGIGETIRALMENPFAKSSSRLRGAKTSTEFGQMRDGNAFQKRLIDSIKASITTLLDALAGVTIPEDLGDRFKPLKDAADAIKAAVDTLNGLKLPENLDEIMAAMQQMIGFGSSSGGSTGGGGGGGAGTNRWGDLEYFGKVIGDIIDRWGDLEYFGGETPAWITSLGDTIDKWADLEYFGGDTPAWITTLGAIIDRWGDLEYFGGGGTGGGGGAGTYGNGGGFTFGAMTVSGDTVLVQNATIDMLGVTLDIQVGDTKLAGAVSAAYQKEPTALDQLIKVIDQRRRLNP